jgi:hypothetical protein
MDKLTLEDIDRLIRQYYDKRRKKRCRHYFGPNTSEDYWICPVCDSLVPVDERNINENAGEKGTATGTGVLSFVVRLSTVQHSGKAGKHYSVPANARKGVHSENRSRKD